MGWKDKCVGAAGGGPGAPPEPAAFSKEVCMRERGNAAAGRRGAVRSALTLGGEVRCTVLRCGEVRCAVLRCGAGVGRWETGRDPNPRNQLTNSLLRLDDAN